MSREAFEAFLSGKSAGAIVGMTAAAESCPYHTYIAEQNSTIASQVERDRTYIYTNSTPRDYDNALEVLHPDWLCDFITEVDHTYTDSRDFFPVSTAITAASALDALTRGGLA